VYAFIAPLARAGAAASERATKRKTTYFFDEPPDASVIFNDGFSFQ
jgi:hypothetical protein